MSDSDRVQRWRQRMRAEGKEPLTIWLTTAEKLRLEDQALTLRCSPSELVQRMLAQWHGESVSVTDTVTDTEQIRAIVQHELAQAHDVTDTVTDTVTSTLQQTLPAMVRTLLQEQQAGSVTATVTDTATDTSTGPRVDYIPEPAPEHVADTVSATVVVPMTYPVTVTTTDTMVVPMTYPIIDPVTATVTDTVTATAASPPAKRKAPSRQRSATTTVADTVTVTETAPEPFDTTKYRLGKLCPRGHDYHGTGQSLRKNNKAGGCLACDAEQARERRQAKRQEVSA